LVIGQPIDLIILRLYISSTKQIKVYQFEFAISLKFSNVKYLIFQQLSKFYLPVKQSKLPVFSLDTD